LETHILAWGEERLMKSEARTRRRSLELGVDLAVLLGISIFLLRYFRPELLLSKTITAGGDTASHYYSAYYMRNILLPRLKVIGWAHGNYAGFPMFQFYFFLPFLLMALLAQLIPLQIAFKLVTALGTFLLPLTAYLSMRSMRYSFPAPALGALYTLPFLFMEANSMWGGNIPSTLAGEFSYSLSLALLVLYLGLLYRHVEERTGLLRLSLILALVALTHVYTLLLAVVSSGYFLITAETNVLAKRTLYLLKIHLLAFLLTAFWSVPMLLKLSYTTPFAVVWRIKGLSQVFPEPLLPFHAIALLWLLISILSHEERTFYYTFIAAASALLYTASPWLGIVDIRFLPFLQLFPVFPAAHATARAARRLGIPGLAALLLLPATLLWVTYNVTYIPSWIEWNYSGFEAKPMWHAYRDVNEYLRGSFTEPRVVYEHTMLHNSAGTPRAFESLPLFAGRATLEGVYMQSSVSAPFVFYIQSELSEAGSCPFPQWSCATLNVSRAARHLEVFNVGQVIARTAKVKRELRRSKLYELEKSFGPYQVYRLVRNRSGYVEVPRYWPVQVDAEDWKELSYLWFTNDTALDVPLVFTSASDSIIHRSGEPLPKLERRPIKERCSIAERIAFEEIRFNTTCPGIPHIIKFSYFPNWKVRGADKIYLVSPSFMLVYPSERQVVLRYGRTSEDLIGMMLTLLGLGVVVGWAVKGRGDEQQKPS